MAVEPGYGYSVYQVYDTTANLIYVDCTRNLQRRLEQHSRDKPWWGEVSGVMAKGFDTVEGASQSEQQLIRELRPRYTHPKRPYPVGRQPSPPVACSVNTPKLVELRIDEGMSRGQLAEQAGVSQTTVWKIEHGGRANARTLKKLGDALGVRASELMR